MSAPLRIVFSICILVLFTVCQDRGKKEESEQENIPKETTEKAASSIPVVTISTSAMEFKTRDTWQSGWTTIKYRNNSNETHFVLFDKYPEGKGIKDAETELIPPFQEGMNAIIEGKPEEANAAFANIPEWFQAVEFKGGIGLTAPKSTSESTIYLEPGTYLLECYVKMPNGIFHSSQGMLKEIKVTKADSTELNLQEDYIISIDANNGISFNGNITAGDKVFKVEFGEQKVHENFVMHDVNLVWVDQGADISKLNDWMNWAAPEGLQTPMPQGFKFLGGMQEMKSGGTGYFSAKLRPGNYAFIAEVPDPQSKGMLKTFTVK